MSDPETLTDPRATPEAVNELVAQAYAAFTQQWRQRTFRDSSLVTRIADGLQSIGAQLIATAGEESALTRVRLTGELTRTVNQLRSFAAVSADGEFLDAIIDTARPEATPPRPDQRRMAMPIGPVAVFEAGNFPLAFGISGGDTASALAAGCPVIAKIHPGHPRTSRLVAQAISEACAEIGAPESWYATLEGDSETGQELANAPDLAAIAFTGSFAGGRALQQTGAMRDRPIPVFSEMGSINPVFITPEAAATRGEAIAGDLATAIGASLGQLCTKPGLIALVDDEPSRALLDHVRTRLSETESGQMLDPGIQARFADHLHAAKQDSRVTVTLDGKRNGSGQSPALLELEAEALEAEDPRLEEIFGPAAVIAWCDDADALERLAMRWTLGTLTATIYTASDTNENGVSLRPLIRELARHAGRVVLNAPPTGVTVGYATVHGGPWPATSAPASTSVGMTAVQRFLRPVGFQSVDDDLLPPELQDANPRGLQRLVDGSLTRAAVIRQT